MEFTNQQIVSMVSLKRRLYSEINKLDDQIKEMQNDCSHDYKEIKKVGYGRLFICKHCQHEYYD